MTYQQIFDIENRLVVVTVNGQTTTFVYDGDGVRVKKTDAGGTTYTPGEHYEVKGGVVTKYYYLGGQRVAMKVGSTVYWLHGDHLGSASLTTNSSGGIYAQQRYFPYGEVRWQSGTLPTDRQYTDQRNETTLGIYDYKARFYSPYLGRFLSADTLVPGVGSQHLSRYMYVTGNAVRYNDPTGHARPTDDDRAYMWTKARMLYQYRTAFKKPYIRSETNGITQGFSSKHKAEDIGGIFNVYAPANGIVVYAGADGEFGVWEFGKLATPDEQGAITVLDRQGNPVTVIEIQTIRVSNNRPGFTKDGLEKARDALAQDTNWVELCPECSHEPGTKLVIDHGNGGQTVYHHVQIDPKIRVGLTVKPGDLLGKTANIGWSYGAHLHYGVRWGRNDWIDPDTFYRIPQSR